jgi:hypothetical protein
LATLIERSRSRGASPAANSAINQCSVNRLHTRLTLRFTSRPPAKANPGRVTLELSKNKKESWLSIITLQPTQDGSAMLATYLARCHSCFQNQIVKDRRGSRRLSSHNLLDLFSTDMNVCPTGGLPMDRGRQGSFSLLDRAALPASGHLRWRRHR